jgi:hypothetical protein
MAISWSLQNEFSYPYSSSYPVLGVCDYPITTSVSSTAPQYVQFSIQLYNPLAVPIYVQVSPSVNLASGSTALMPVSTVNLGEIGSSSTSYIIVTNAISITSFPTTTNAYENETINLTLNVYTDSAYSDLYETGSSTGNIFMFANSTNSNWSTYVNYDGTNSTSSYNLSTSTLVPTFVTSPVVVSSGYALEISSATVPSGDWIGFPSNDTGYNPNDFILNESLIYLSSTLSTTSATQFFNGLPTYEVNAYNTYISNYPGSQWNIIYALGGESGSYSGGHFYYTQFKSFTDITYYVGYQRTIEIGNPF